MADRLTAPRVDSEMSDLKRRVTNLERVLRDGQRPNPPMVVAFHPPEQVLPPDDPGWPNQ